MWVSDTDIEFYSCSDIIPIVIGGVVAVVIVLLGSIANYVIWKRNNGKNSSCVIFLKWISCMTLYLLIIDLIKRKKTYLVRIKQMLFYVLYYICYVILLQWKLCGKGRLVLLPNHLLNDQLWLSFFVQKMCTLFWKSLYSGMIYFITNTFFCRNNNRGTGNFIVVWDSFLGFFT